jgi:hypothetical protein
MASFEEKVYISEFNILSNGSINVRKTTEILKDGVSISQTYWRCVLTPSETIDTEILNEPYYANLAQAAWTPEVIAAYQASIAESNNNI